ncbi:chemotaxis protein CheA [Yoonia sp.]|uniref:chemotaxis protein CheA n=1 Tax=Yoonia sp. TaxID=2212373 RepID=UPI002E000323|nr:chemotaxis protein CheA [Yoonia sp.]
MTDSAILDAFFEECEDLLVALSDGLEDMRDGKADNETVNAVFRSVHSIKGAAGAFSLEDLVGFAHIFETVLDEVRAGKLSTDDTLLRVLQRAGDILADLVDAARDGLPADAEQVDPVVTELQSFLGADSLVEEEFVFEALTLALDSAPTTATYQVQFRPSREFYATGNDPALMIAALQDLGPCSVRALIGDLPEDFADFQWDEGYLTWLVDVADQQNDLAAREVFQFVDDLCDLHITEQFDDETDPLAEEIAPVIVPAPETERQTQQTAQEPAAEICDVEDTLVKADKPAKRPASTLRVDPERVDRLINAVGELIINQSVISQRIDEAGLPNSAELHGDLDDYKLLAREIQEGVMAIRAQPVKPLFQRMLRIAREAADATGKDVNLVTEGDGTEVDKIVVERLADPLTHMIRNAIDHGIEKPQDRISAGKLATGTLRLTASQRSGSIVIEIIDDGAGLNRKRIKEIAISKGLISADMQLTEQEIDHLLFAPGFSTAAEVTNLSGRGVGMDVVKTAITALGGRIAISSITGQGTTFSITLPLTLAVMDGMIINVGGQTMVVPISSILETIRPTKTDLSRIGLHSQLLRIRGDYVPIIDLADRLGVRSSSETMTDRVLLLIQTESVTQCALAVDDIFDQRQVVVKSMQGSYGEIAGISGATILGDGKIALIIDPDAIAAAPTTELKMQIQAQREVAHAAT